MTPDEYLEIVGAMHKFKLLDYDKAAASFPWASTYAACIAEAMFGWMP